MCLSPKNSTDQKMAKLVIAVKPKNWRNSFKRASALGNSDVMKTIIIYSVYPLLLLLEILKTFYPVTYTPINSLSPSNIKIAV